MKDPTHYWPTSENESTFNMLLKAYIIKQLYYEAECKDKRKEKSL